MAAHRKSGVDGPKAGGVTGYVVVVLVCALIACVSFFGFLAIWGAVAAPVVHLRSASFIIVVAFALSGVFTASVYRTWRRRLSKRPRGQARP